MIGLDWGTTSLRAYRLQNGTVLERRDSPDGITRIVPGAFATVLQAIVGDWLAAGETRILMAGMVGSRQGWVEAPYLPCPASPAALAAALTPVPFNGATVAIIPGLTHRDAADIPEVMRGEETQLAGAIAQLGNGLFCLPGTHSKWATVTAGAIVDFSTAMTGEVFAAMRAHTILGRMMTDGPPDDAAFLRGVTRVSAPGGLLHHLFGVRTLGLFGELGEGASASYLSGLLIGSELAAINPATPVRLIGEPTLCRRYALALSARSIAATTTPPDMAAAGLALIAENAGWM